MGGLGWRVVRPGSRCAAQAAAWPSPQVRGRGVITAMTTDENTAANAAPLVVNTHLNRSKAMQLMHEDLARAHSQHRLEELIRHERSRRLVRAHRAARRAEEAALRARRLLALVVVR